MALSLVLERGLSHWKSQSPGREQRLWPTALEEFQGPIFFRPSLNVNGLLGSYLPTLALLRSEGWTSLVGPG